MDIRLMIKIALIPVALLAASVTKHFWNGYRDDNAVEEIAEQVIKHETGQEVDLTPESPEKK